jgi:hypothetical protein
VVTSYAIILWLSPLIAEPKKVSMGCAAHKRVPAEMFVSVCPLSAANVYGA